MTTAKKLWLGFGTLFALLLASSLFNATRLSGVQTNLNEITAVTEPASAAAYQMEINIHGTGLGVLHYLDMMEPRYRKRVEHEQAKFQDALTRYRNLTKWPNLGERLGHRYRDYAELGDKLMKNRDDQQALFVALSQSSERIEEFLRKEIQESIDRMAPDGAAKVEEVVTMRANSAAVGAWLGHYRRTDEANYRDRITRHERRFQASLDTFLKLPLTETEMQRAREAGSQFKRFQGQVGTWLALHTSQLQNLEEFQTLGKELDDLLDGEIQQRAKQDLAEAKDVATRHMQTILTTLTLALLASMLIGGGMAILIGGGIVRTEATLRVTLTSIGDAVVLTDTDGVVTFLNAAAQSLTGWTMAEAVGKPLATVVPLLHKETRLPIENPLIRVMQLGISTGQAKDALLVARDGTERSLDDSAALIRDALGKCLGVVLVFRDVSERRRELEKLRASEERFRQLANTVPAFVWTATADGALNFANEKWYDYSGLTPEQTMGWDWEAAIHPEDREHCHTAWTKATREGTFYEIEARNRAANGTYRWFLTRAMPVRDTKGNLTSWFGTTTDIDAQKRAEAKLRASEEWLQHLADAMPQIVWSARPEGTFDYFNQRWYEFTASQPGDSTHGWKPVLHPDDLATWQDRWAEAVRKGAMYQIECRLRNKQTGVYRWHLCRALPVRDHDAQIIRWYGTCTDIDQQKRTEETLKMADRRKDEFLAVLAHELRNPLAPIRNALHILRLGKMPDPELADARDVIDRQVGQLAGIVDDLLDVFRIAHQKMQLQKEPLNLVHLVRQTLEDHRSNLESNRLDVTLEMPEEAVWVNADRRRLGQVITNLLTNAAKYTNPGDQVILRVSVDAASQRALVSVRDTGIGIAPELLTHIFETFIQGEQNTDRRRGGLGLGLALVRGIVELHGGAVRAASEGTGQGTDIIFWLPLGQKPRSTAMHLVSQSPGRRLRILIVEDSIDTARTLAKLLTRYGHEVVMAHTGTAGLESARTWRPEVVLCDLGLPEMDGFEVARALRSDADTASLRLIAVSGYGQEEDRRRSEEAGFDLHLTKPVDPTELQRLLTVLKVGP